MSETNFVKVLETFPTGATRHNDSEKLDFEGFISPLALESYAKYMHTHRKQADGSLRDSDNWQKGIPLAKYMKSLWRHVFAAWKIHRGYTLEKELIGGEWKTPTMEDCLNGILFNTFGYLHEYLKGRQSAQINPQAIKNQLDRFRDAIAPNGGLQQPSEFEKYCRQGRLDSYK